MFLAVTLPLVGLLVALPGLPKIPGLPGFGVKDIKKLRQGPAPPLDSLPPAWKPASRLALENQFVLTGLRPLGPEAGLKLNQDPRKLRVRFDSDSGTVRYVAEVGEFTVQEPSRVPLANFTRELTERNFARLWGERARQGLQSATTPTAVAPRLGGLTFEFPSPLPRRFQGLLGPGNPSLTVSGSENISLSGKSEWSNQQFGLLGQRRSLFPSLDMQQDLDIRLEGRLSDRVGVNLLQNSANQVPLANRVAINYKGDEDDLVQALDLGNTNLTLPGTQYVSYSGRNEGLFGMKATTRMGPLDVTILASKQEGRSERASYAGGSSRQSQILGDREYVKGVYFFLYDPNTPSRDIDESSLRVFLDEGVNINSTNIARGRAFVDPNDAVIYPSGVAQPDTTPAVHGSFRLLTAGADQDYEILRDVYGPLFKVIRLRSALTGENQRLAVIYRYRNVDAQGQPVGDSIRVGGESDVDYDGVPALRMMLIRPPTGADFMDRNGDGFFDAPSDSNPFPAARELELRNFYQLAGQRIDPASFNMTILQGDEQPPRTTVPVEGTPPPGARVTIPYIELLGLDNYDESSSFIDFDTKGHDGRVDGTALTATFRAFVDFERGTIFLPDLRPFAPRLGPDSTGRPFERAISRLLFRSDSLVGSPPPPGQDAAPNAANPAIYDKRTVLTTDRLYSIEVQFTAARAGNEISLGRTNIIEGSDVVTINGQALQRDKDYRIDYDLGRVTLIRRLGPADQLNIDYGYAPLFQQAGRTLIGNAFRWEGTDRSFGGAFLYESKGAQDLRPRLGEEPSRVLIGDLNTDWRFKPDWITRLVDRLPGVRTTTGSELNIQAEVGASMPNPNTRNEVFIDDMEGVRDAIGLSMGPERWRWTSIPLRPNGLRVDEPAAPNMQRNTEIHWFSPLNAVKERDLKPSLTDAQGAQNTRQVLALSLPRRPTGVPDPNQRLWAGLTYPLDAVGVDLSRAQFIEVWVNDFRDHHNGVPVPRVRGRNVQLHIDLGRVAEDQQRAPNIPPNGLLDSEDQPSTNRDNELIVTDQKNEDTGLDARLNTVESRDTIPDLTTVTSFDSQGDDFSLPNNDFKDWDPRKWRFTNGTEGNKNVIPVPDTEDLDLRNTLDTRQDYFEYTIDLGDTAHRYLVTDVFKTFTTYANNGEAIAAENGWRRYRIPIADSLRDRFGAPDLTLAQHVRLWIEDVIETDPPPISSDDGRPFIAIGGLEIVGSRWLASDLDSASVEAGTTITLNSVNTVDNADIYVAPFDPGQTRSGSQELTRREQSLALEFTDLEGRDTVEVYKTFSLDEDYSRYGKLNFYAAGFGIPNYDEVADSLDYFLRFASDEKGTSYYEYRSRVPRSSTPGVIHWKEIALTLSDLSNLKLNQDFPSGQTGILYRAPGKNPGEEYVIKGRPSFTRLRRISFGIINASGKPFPAGQVWLNELRATDVAKELGRAQRVSVNGRFANLLTYNMLWNGRDADFQSVGEARGAGNRNGSFSVQTGLELHRFFEGTRIVLPVNLSYSTNQSTPRFTAGDDVIRTGPLAEASDARTETRSFSANYSRNWSDRSHPLLRHTLGGITAALNGSQTDSRNPLTTDAARSISGSVNYSISPRQLLRLPIPATKLAFFPLPERFYWNYSVQTNQAQSFERLPDSNGVFQQRYDNQGRVASIDFGADTRPFDFFHHGFTARRNLTLPNELLEQIGFINLGRVVSWSQTMDARFTLQKYGPWLKPNLSWNSRYFQDNGPHLSPNLTSKAINNNQVITLSWDLPFDQLVNPRPLGTPVGTPAATPAPPDTSKRAIAVPVWRSLLSRLGAVSINGGFNTNSSHSRMTGMPGLGYFLGVQQDPGFGDDSTGQVRRQFGNSSAATEDWRAGGQTTLNLGFGATLLTRADYATTFSVANRVTNRSNRIRFPELDLNYGRVAEVIGLSRFLTNPRLETRFNRSQTVNFANSNEATSISTSSEWRPLVKLSGDLKNGTRCQVMVERRVTQSENRQLGNSLTTDRNSNASLEINRSYSKGQKVSLLGKETTVRSSINLGLSAAYELQDGETVQQGQSAYEIKRDRLSVSAKGGYSFSTNVTGNLDLGFGQDRDLIKALTRRSVRVELRAQFTF